MLPLIIQEMAYAHRVAATGREVDAATFVPSQAERDAIEDILWPLRKRQFASLAEFRAFDALVRADLREAEAGNLGSPVKAATDVLRDTREALRSAVEYGGLTPASHRYFVEEFNAVTNRISFGPPRRRNLEYLALHAAGIIDIAGGPGPGCERTRPARGSASKRAMASAWKPARRTCSSWPGWMPILR